MQFRTSVNSKLILGQQSVTVRPATREGTRLAMRSHIKIVGASVLLAGSAFAQNTFPATGKVGIGTTDPQRQLVIVSPDSNTTPWVNTSNTLLLINPMADVFQHESEIIFNNGSSNFSGIAGNYDVYGNQAGGSLRFGTKSGNSSNGANILERMRITSEGSIGIGTTVPTAKLHVEGSGAGVVLNVGGTGGALNFSGTGVPSPPPGLNYGFFPQSGVGLGLYSIAGGMSFWGGSTPTAYLTINTNGNVGLGTTTPGVKLDVAGQIRSSSGGIVFPDGSVQATAYTQVTSGSNTITQLNGNVGIGTTTPQAMLHISGANQNGNANPLFKLTDTNTNQIFTIDNGANANDFRIVTWGGTTGDLELQAGANGNQVVLNHSGNVGIGTANPETNLQIAAPSGGGLRIGAIGDPGNTQVAFGAQTLQYNLDFTGYRDIRADQIGARIAAQRFNNYVPTPGAVQTTGLAFFTNPSGGNSGATDLVEQMFIAPAGNVGVGTISPGAKLEVNGNVKLTPGSGASLTFPDNTVQYTAWNGTTLGGDYAESVNVAGDRARYEPGDVLVIGKESGSDVLKSTEPYSTMVTGIYSTKPGIVGRRQTGDPKVSTNEVPMAMVGIVPTKVSAENGAIERGDLLVTSSTPGYAMKGTDRGRMLGAVVGKALGSLDSGTGLIEVVVTLQ